VSRCVPVPPIPKSDNKWLIRSEYQSIFSTSLFNWSATEGESVVSSYIWILVVLSVGLTFVTMLAWHCVTTRDKKREGKRKDIELDEMV